MKSIFEKRHGQFHIIYSHILLRVASHFLAVGVSRLSLLNPISQKQVLFATFNPIAMKIFG